MRAEVYQKLNSLWPLLPITIFIKVFRIHELKKLLLRIELYQK